MKGESIKYPESCKSWACGKINCPKDCPNIGKLNNWKKWRNDTKAVEKDPIWSPGVFTSTI